MKLLFVLAGLLISLSAVAQDQTEDAQDSAQAAVQPQPQEENTRPIEEIEVISQRSFTLLRVNIRYAEKKLFAAFNELNTDDDFDVRCRKSDYTHTRIQGQVCYPAFFDDAIAENSQDSLRGLANFMTPAEIRVHEQGNFKILEATMLKLAEEHDSLRNEILELSGLEREFRERKDACMKEPAVLFLLRRC